MVNEMNIGSVLAQAFAAGHQALVGATPTPMVVSEDRLNGRSWFCGEGVCGFAWVNVYGVRQTSKLGKKLVSAGFRRNSYEKALQFWVSDGGQSMDRKEAYAHAMAKVLREAGLTAYPGSRMD